jgi:hypothetical protein
MQSVVMPDRINACIGQVESNEIALSDPDFSSGKG